MQFTITLDRDGDGTWITGCPSIPGCVSQGQTKEEAVANIREAIQLCLEVRAERGQPLTIETQHEATRQRGSHIILVKENHNATLSVPDHKEVAKGTLRSLIRSAGYSGGQIIVRLRSGLQTLGEPRCAAVERSSDGAFFEGETPSILDFSAHKQLCWLSRGS